MNICKEDSVIITTRPDPKMLTHATNPHTSWFNPTQFRATSTPYPGMRRILNKLREVQEQELSIQKEEEKDRVIYTRVYLK